MSNDRKLVLEVNHAYPIGLLVTDNADILLTTNNNAYELYDHTIININKTKYLTVYLDDSKTAHFLYPIPNSETMLPIVTEYLNVWNKKALLEIKNKRERDFLNNIDFTLRFIRKNIDNKKYETRFKIYPIEQPGNERPIIQFEINMNAQYDKSLNHKRYFDLKDKWLSEYVDVFPQESYFLKNINVVFKQNEVAL